MSKVLKFLFNEIVYSGHLQALSAAGIVYLSSVITLKVYVGIEFFVLVYLVFQFVYYFDRFRDVAKDALSNKSRTEHIRVYLNKIPILMGVMVLAITIGFLFFSNFYALIFAFVIMVMGILYPIYFKGLTKRIYLFKNLYVSAVFATLVFFPVIYYFQKLLDVETLILFVLTTLFFVENLINQIAFDFKDVKSDKLQGLLTLPVLLGKSRSLIVLQSLSLVAGLFYVGLFTYLKLGSYLVFLIILNVFVNIVFLKMIYKNKIVGYIIASGKFFLWFLVLFLINIIL